MEDVDIGELRNRRRAIFWVVLIVAVSGFFVVRAISKSNQQAKRSVVSEALDTMIGPITPELVLGAGIPLKPKASLKGPYADSLARHVKVYLKQNPDEAARYIELTKGEEPPEIVLEYERMLEHSQYLRTVILRAVLMIKTKGNWEFCSAIDEGRLRNLVQAQERNPDGYFLGDGENDTLRQGEEYDF
jgi:hypothetical protein